MTSTKNVFDQMRNSDYDDALYHNGGANYEFIRQGKMQFAHLLDQDMYPWSVRRYFVATVDWDIIIAADTIDELERLWKLRSFL